MTERARTFAGLRPTGATPNADADYLALCFNRVFTSNDGQVVWNYLRKQTFDAVLGADASDGALRMKEGQRQLMQRIESLIANGGSKPE